MVDTPPKKSYCDILKSYIFLLWDGLAFFGFSHNKIDRLKGKLPRWWDRFLNWKYMTVRIIFAGIILKFLIQEYGEVGDIKSQ
jgi:hypothetical protein